MRSVFILLVACLGLISTSFAQEKSTVAEATNKAEIAASKEAGIYRFIMPEGTTDETIVENSKYYTRYFTTSYDVSTRVVTITMVQNDNKNRHVIVRFFGACGIQSIQMEGKEYMTEDFFTKFMQ